MVGINKIFFGFEYEDAFVSSFVASQDNPLDYSDNYRTQGCHKLIDNKCYIKKTYTGHYITYSLFLKIWDKIFKINPYYLHRIGNLILYVFTVIFSVFIIKSKRPRSDLNNLIYFFILLSTSIPSIYVLNSSLIENISISINILTIVFIYIESFERRSLNKVIIIILLSISIIIKRENLIMLPLLALILRYNDLKKKEIILSFSFLIISQTIINPFYTEFIEAEQLEKATFSIDYLIFQLPQYLKTFISYNGFLNFSLALIILTRPTLKTFYFIALFFAFIILYSFHYRSQYAIEDHSISLFETYRYMTNTTPLLLGAMLFSKNRELLTMKALMLFIFIFSYVNSYIKMEDFINEEIRNYHLINERIEDSIKLEENALIIDNFVLVTLLNLKHKKNIDVLQYENRNLSRIDTFKYAKIYLINRFKLIDTSSITKRGILLKKIPHFSIDKTDVYEITIKEKDPL